MEELTENPFDNEKSGIVFRITEAVKNPLPVRELKTFMASRQRKYFIMIICPFKTSHHKAGYQGAILQTKSASK